MINELKKRPIIPVIVIDDAADALPLAEALLEGGMDVIEVTFRTAAAAEAISLIGKKFPEMLLGAGTLLTEEQGQRALDAGIKFGLAPGLNPDVVNFFKAKNTLFIPGVMTPSEIEQGLALGCKLQKFFPAEAAGGIKMLKALAGPYASQGLQFCPTGGVSLANMNDYLALPIVSNIGGSWLATKQQIADKQWGAITAQVKDALAKV
ncbi:bifunctional 4-hydroxy-2-oxoglutarate aldolase/2-dehydro-3-deoxy-phosphogluconate aldolase [Pelobacter seleniigenes]|uniref:bifunctional 4-hydroxy-2-oxoglutarate aldolase/2-dehydro-3-deoxy-phosphogluconate aldolase n=1 Tax=Pelobacter seleniigenes TaxID=407188 RepID=UPI0004A6D29A|nr:bifunctional 4-hydroxy-2-oxoglutarate aldolase/2-dehydro-3-deoxy-phosphogluconate aldolase [Pelobacter seleniigenes]